MSARKLKWAERFELQLGLEAHLKKLRRHLSDAEAVGLKSEFYSNRIAICEKLLAELQDLADLAIDHPYEVTP